ncbi:protein of unknown function [Candidatus Nitrotoga arctica]|uniref:Uncharacterized protein n=1 Tax=Candidatus Nitrotoga arctica TaxID=453162 RepID=A0ABN8ANU2_9PROT|nr:protein of unknown function [Candidatus Nitrotoga arctica]
MMEIKRRGIRRVGCSRTQQQQRAQIGDVGGNEERALPTRDLLIAPEHRQAHQGYQGGQRQVDAQHV